MLLIFVIGLLFCREITAEGLWDRFKRSSFTPRLLDYKVLYDETPDVNPEYSTQPEKYLIARRSLSRRDTPDDYIEIKGLGSYKVYEDERAWEEANDICKDDNGNLAVIRSVFEAIKVRDMLGDRSQSMFWLGVRREFVGDGPFVFRTTLNGVIRGPNLIKWQNNIKTDSNMLYGPDNTRKQCVLFTKSSGVITAPCEYPTAFLCKREPQ